MRVIHCPQCQCDQEFRVYKTEAIPGRSDIRWHHLACQGCGQWGVRMADVIEWVGVIRKRKRKTVTQMLDSADKL